MYKLLARTSCGKWLQLDSCLFSETETGPSFHAIYLPMMLLALDLPLSQRLLSHSHWTVNRHKMSKSVGNVADPIEAIDEFGIDVVRWYLARVGGHFRDDVGEPIG